MPTGTGDGRGARAALIRLACAAAAAALLAPAAAAAPRVRVHADVDRREVALGETVRLTVRIEAPGAPEAVEFAKGARPFEVVSRSSSRESSVSLGGAGVTFGQVTVHRLELRPRAPGAMVIPQVIVRVEGDVYATDPIRVAVSPAAARPEPPPRGRHGGWERDVALRLELDRDEVFVGEQVTASLWILSRAAVTNRAVAARPAFDGWWTERLSEPDPIPETRRTVDGIPLRAYRALQLALFPTRAGELTVGRFEEELSVRVPSESPFSRFLDDVRVVRRATAPAKVRVRPLPEGAPPGFEAVNVGRLALEVRAPAAATAGEPFAVQVIATGEGNLRVLSLPRLPPIAGARAFEPALKDRVDPRGERLAGSRTLETVLVPERTGELVVPALSWPIFDPRAKAYRTLETAELRIPVRPGAAGTAPAAADPLEAGLRPIRAGGALGPSAPPPWRTPGFLVLLALPPLAYAGAALALRARERGRAGADLRRARGAGSAARRRLDAARRRLGGDRAALLAEVARALEGYASDRLGRPAAGLTREALAAALADAGGHPPAVKELVAALDRCDAARYGGAADDERELVDGAERALAALEEAEWKAAPAAGRGARP